MKRFLFALATILLLHIPVQAKQKGTPIVYSKSVPAEVRALAPKRSLTVFYGTGRLSSPDRVIALHVYLPGVKVRQRGTFEVGNYKLAVFMREGREKKLQRVNLITFKASNEFQTVDASVWWVDPKHRHIPVICLDFSEMLFTGVAGSQFLFNFAHGLGRQAIMQEIYRDAETVGASLDELDEHGYMKLTWPPQNGPGKENEYEPGVMYWNGTLFERRKKANPPIDVEIFFNERPIAAGVMERGTTTVPLRQFLTGIGATVEYRHGTITIIYNGVRRSLREMVLRYERHYGTDATKTVGEYPNKTLLVPLRLFSEESFFTTKWDPEKRRVTIYP